MTVRFEEKKGKKTHIYIEGKFLGALYPKDIYEYDLEDEAEISEDIVERILQETLIPRAKRYVMNLLVKSDKTEAELKRKLKENGYNEETSQAAIEYVRSFHYIDELRTAENFIRARMDSSSEMEIRYKLSGKGIDDETVDMAYEQILESIDPENEMDGTGTLEVRAAENFLKKKLGSRLSEYCDEESEKEISYEERQKLMAAAARKGFKTDSIRTALENLLKEKE